MSGTTFPPSTPTVATAILPSYLYQEYSDDDNLQALVAAQNILAQNYLNQLIALNLPIYTLLSAPLLDWIGAGLYGLPRPSIASGQIVGIGPLNTWALNTLTLNTFILNGSVQNPTVTDDIYKRILTWYFFKGDGQQFCAIWLKRRIMRFLTCVDGVATNIDNTYPVSVEFNGGGSVTITITLTDSYGIPLSVAQIFQAAVAAGVLPMPFQLTEIVVIVNDLGPTGLSNNGGLLQVNTATGWPTSPGRHIQSGAVWDNGALAAVAGTTSPSPFAAPVFYGLITSSALLVLGGANLPLSDPHVVDQLWNNGGLIAISNG